MIETSYLDKLRGDMIEQFRGKPNIEALNRALSRQLDELYGIFYDLHTLRWLHSAEGAQLDGIGNIVCLTRMEALALSKRAGKNVPMDDPTYRIYLTWKIALNTTNCTHKDVYNAIRMFWDVSPLYYHEEIEHPATIFFNTPPLSLDEGVIDAAPLSIARMTKAAGVALLISCDFEPIPFFNAELFRLADLAWRVTVQEGSARIKGNIFNGARDFDGEWTWESSYQGIGFTNLAINGIGCKQEYGFSGKVTIDSSWSLDGSFKLDGSKKLDAEIKEVAL